MFTPDCRPILIGSLPLAEHAEAVRLILAHTPEIPLWPQLPRLPKEGMVRQFLSGYPGLAEEADRFFVDSEGPGFADEMAAFYEEYLAVAADPSLLRSSRFALAADTAAGFAALRDALAAGHVPLTVKGQVTGPVTAGIGARDGRGRSIFYDDNLRDMLVKLLSGKAAWQVAELRRFTGGMPPIVFIDEPGMVSFGSSGFAGVGREMAAEAVAEVIAAIHEAGGLAGIHICANGDWGPALDSAADIISFDAYFYFDNFILYRQPLSRFLSRGGMLAWGIVPTGDPQAVLNESAASLFAKWLDQLAALAAFGFSEGRLMSRTFIAPSCGTGSLTQELAEKVLAMTCEVSRLARTGLARP